MRLIGRANKPEEPTTKTAEIVLQVGNNKIQLPADRFTADDETLRPANTSDTTSDDQEKGFDTLMRMRQNLQYQSTFPFSPDDFHPTHQRVQSAPQDTTTLSPPQLPTGWDRRPSNNLPEAYEPSTHPPTTFCPAVPKPDVMPLRHRPTIFDNIGEMPRQRPSPAVEPRKRNSVHEKKTDRIKRHLFPDRSPSTMNASGSKSRPGTGLTSSTSTGGNPRRPFTDFGDDVVQATKTNVRRPPKGIEHWFDGFISSDEDEEDEDLLEQGSEPRHVVGAAQAMPPQELPADDVPPPAYSNLVRGASTASHWSNRSYTPGDDNPPPFSHGDEKAPIDRTESVSTTVDSLRSSQSQSHRQNSDRRLSRSRLASESVLALSDQSTSENEPDERRGVPNRRNETDEEQSIRLEAAARVHMQRIGLSHEVPKNRTYSSDDVSSIMHSSVAPASGLEQIYPGRHQHYRLESHTADPLDPTAQTMRRAQNANSGGTRVSTASSNGRTFQMDDRTILATDSISNVPVGNIPTDAYNMIMVTDEERALLDMMRRKRAAMAQLSFTEGYHHALRREQASPMRRSASADSLAQEILDQREHPTTVTSHEIMRKKLSALQKQDVDEALKMQRFLGIQSRTVDGEFAWPRDSMMPTTLPTSQPRNGSNVSENYSQPHTERDSAYQTWSPHTEGYGFEDQSKLAQHVMSNAMASSPPAPTSTQRTTSHHNTMSSPVQEEEPSPDEPDEEADRGRREDDGRKYGKRLSRSVDTSPVLRTPAALSFRSPTFDAAASPTNVNFSPLQSIIAASLGEKNRRSPSNDTPDTEAPQSGIRSSKRLPKRTFPHLQVHDGADNPRDSMTSITSAGEDVLTAWANLGGGSDCLQLKRRPATATPQSP